MTSETQEAIICRACGARARIRQALVWVGAAGMTQAQEQAKLDHQHQHHTPDAPADFLQSPLAEVNPEFLRQSGYQAPPHTTND